MQYNKRYLPFLIIFSLIAVCIEIDISVPSFPDMVRYFNADVQTVQSTLTFNFIGICLSGLVYGPLSDCYGRRKVMLFGGFLFMIGSMGCVLAPSIEVMIGSRFVQGIGASSILIVVYAIIADAYEGTEVTRMMGIMNATVTAFMAFAPVMGGLINQHFGWQANYMTVAALSVVSLITLVAFLPETLMTRKTFSVREIFSGYGRLLGTLEFDIYALMGGVMLAAYIGYVACASFLYIDTMGLSMNVYSLNQAIIIAVFSGMSLVVGRIQQILGMKRMVIVGVISHIIAAGGLLGMAALDILEPAPLTFFMSFYSIGNALLFNVAIVFAMEMFPDLKGSVAAMLSSIRLIVVSACIYGTGLFFDTTLTPIAVAIGGMTAVNLLMMIFIFGPIRKIKELA